MMTHKGVVVYKREKHVWTAKDLYRIIVSMGGDTSAQIMGKILSDLLLNFLTGVRDNLLYGALVAKYVTHALLEHFKMDFMASIFDEIWNGLIIVGKRMGLFEGSTYIEE
ncbi:hypothetical protein ES703_114128 [subsurface metagenome]